MKTVENVRALPHLGGGRIDLTWTLPPTTDFELHRRLGGVRVVRRERTFPRNSGDGRVIYDGAPVTGVSDRAATPHRTYYYTVYAVEEDEPTTPAQRDPVHRADQRSQATSLATADYGSSTRLYQLLPDTYRVQDADEQLRRFLRAAASPLDLMRSTAEALHALHDVDVAPPTFLPLLGQWIGWDVDGTLPVYEQRNRVKFAPWLYRRVGSVDALRRLVTSHTGWYTQAAEMDEAIVRANQPAQLNLFASAEVTGGLLATDDAANALGFGTGNRRATGVAGPPADAAKLTGSVTGPFALRPGMELTVAADNRPATTIRFAPEDFGSIGAATAAEVAAVLDATLSQLSAEVVTGRIVLRSHVSGLGSSIEVGPAVASLVSLDGAPHGRLAAFAEGGAAPRLRLFFSAADPLEEARTAAARASLHGEPPVVGRLPGDPGGGPEPENIGRGVRVITPRPNDRIYVKTWTLGQWRAARPLLEMPPVAQGDPAAAPVGSKVLCAWVEEPDSPAARLRFALGTPTAAQPATLLGTRSEPFVLVPGTRLVFGGRWPAAEGVEISAAEIAALGLDPKAANAAGVVSLLGPHLVNIAVAAGPRRTVVFSTRRSAGDERLEIDLELSTAAAELGFGHANAGATGDWGDAIVWGRPADVLPGRPPRRYADTAAIARGAGALLVWASHDGAGWRVESSTWNGTSWSVPLLVAAGAGANRQPAAVVDAAGNAHVFWAQRGVAPDLPWTLRRSTLTAAGTWGAAQDVLASGDLPAAGTDGDHEPAPMRLASGSIRIVFRSDRLGGAQLFATDWNPSGPTATGTTPVPLTTGAAHRANPAPLPGPDGRPWLLHRSDANVALARAGLVSAPAAAARVAVETPPPLPGARRVLSASTEEVGTRRRFAGSTTLRAWDTARLGRRREWDDLIAYVPQRAVLDPALLADDDLYVRGTVGLYLSPTDAGDPFVQQKAQRLLGVLRRFVPVNVRPVVILAPRADIETFVVTDVERPVKVPLVEYWPSPGDSGADALPGWLLFESDVPNGVAEHVSAVPNQFASLRHRTFYGGAMPTDYPTDRVAGYVRDVMRNASGAIVFDSGWQRNVITESGRRLLAGFLHGPPGTTALPIAELRVGQGDPGWDTTGTPPPLSNTTKLVDTNFYAHTTLNFAYIDPASDTAVTAPTTKLEIKALLGPHQPNWPDGPHPTATLREYGLVGKLDGTPVLINYRTHAAIAKDPTSTLERTIWLVF